LKAVDPFAGDDILGSSLSDQLMEDMKSAMRSGNTELRDVIRYLRSALVNREIELRRDLTDDDVLAVIRTQIKQSTDAAEIFRNAGRQELASKEENQIAILRTYLPPQLSEDELANIARDLIVAHGLTGASDMGKLMPLLRSSVGDRADGRMMSQVARQELARAAE
jgi:uncharacterized protein